MDFYEEKLKKYIEDNKIEAQQYVFEDSCHTVEEAAKAANVSVDNIVKNICMITPNDELVVGIVKGEDRASSKRIARALNIESVRVASEREILEKCGYICGGVPSFGYKAIFLIDPKVIEKEIVYTGGGSPNSLVKIKTELLKDINKGQIERIRK